MKKRLLAAMLALILMIAPLTVPAYAYQPGEEIGQVLYTDIVAYIDGHAIRSYNINWNTYIVVEDLTAYGFAVAWLPDEGRLVIAKERTAAPDAYTADYQPEANTYPAGTPAMPYLYTEITTWIGDTQVTGYNIGGYTCICMDDLAAHFAGEYVWSPEDKALYMTSPALSAAPETPAEPDPQPQPPAEEDPSAAETVEQNEAEAWLTAYMDYYLEYESVLDGTYEYTDEELLLIEEMNLLYGEDFYQQSLTMFVPFLRDFTYEITDSTVREDTATVYMTVTCRDMSNVLTEYMAALTAEIVRWSIRGEEMTEEAAVALSMQCLYDAMTDENLPFVTKEVMVFLEYQEYTEEEETEYGLEDGWDFAYNEAERNDPFFDAILGGMMSDEFFTSVFGEDFFSDEDFGFDPQV